MRVVFALMEKEKMATNTANTATASTIHEEIQDLEIFLHTKPATPKLRAQVQQDIIQLKRRLNRINYEASI
jgi:uncharacterized coiled-coil DUF342 family protein